MTNTDAPVLRIHGVSPSTFTRAVRMGCHEKGVPYELVPTRPGALGGLNPFQKIPVITYGDLTLFESTAILRFLDRSFPGPRLWPDGAAEAAVVDQWAGVVCDAVFNSAQRYMAARFNLLPVPPAMAEQYLAKTREVISAIDRRLGESRFLAGEWLTAADLLLAPGFAYFPDVPELRDVADALPHCRRWFAEIAARPSFIATEPDFKPTLAN
jgi:glutathione S-transferase